MSSAIAIWQGFEERTCRFWNRMSRRPRWSLLFKAASRLGNGVFWYAIMLVLALGHRAYGLETAIRMGATGLACTLVYKAIKLTFRRPRPYTVLPGLHAEVPPLDRFSFPSGHTMHACTFTVVACEAFPALAWMLVPFTVVVALSRVVLGLHYASDVAAGALLGTMLGGLAHGLTFPAALASLILS